MEHRFIGSVDPTKEIDADRYEDTGRKILQNTDKICLQSGEPWGMEHRFIGSVDPTKERDADRYEDTDKKDIAKHRYNIFTEWKAVRYGA